MMADDLWRAWLDSLTRKEAARRDALRESARLEEWHANPLSPETLVMVHRLIHDLNRAWRKP